MKRFPEEQEKLDSYRFLLRQQRILLRRARTPHEKTVHQRMSDWYVVKIAEFYPHPRPR